MRQTRNVLLAGIVLLCLCTGALARDIELTLGGNEVVSGFINLDPGIVMTVPVGKTFILTDVACENASSSVGSTLSISKRIDGVYISTKAELYVQEGVIMSYHFNSGLPFAAESEVYVSVGGETGSVTVSGYLINN